MTSLFQRKAAIFLAIPNGSRESFIYRLGARIVVMPGNVQTAAPLGTVALAPSLTTTKLT